MILIQQYYESAREERQNEIDFCLEKNKNCQLIDKIVMLNEKQYDLNVNDKLIIHPEHEKRLTFFDAFCYANQHFEEDTIIIVSNSDIFFTDQELEKIKNNLKNNDCYCLSRWDYYNGQLFDRHDSQDAWIIKTPIRVNQNMDFAVGSLWGCDNVIAYLLNQQKYHVTNPSRSIKTYHVHKDQYYEPTFDQHKTLPPPYYFITPT